MDLVTAEAVYQTLINVESNDAAQRKPAEEQLKQWEQSSARGFLASLVTIVARGNEVHEQVRLLACIVAKNAVGSSCRKTLATREWTKIDPEEKNYLHQTLPELLLKEQSNQVAIQIALFLSNIVRFDFPKEWPDILDELVKVIVTTESVETKYRGVIGLKYIFKALQTKVTFTAGFTMEAVQSAVKEARDMPRKVATQFEFIVEQCRVQLQEFAKAKSTWQSNATLAIELLSVIENSIILVPDLTFLEPSLGSFFETILECSKAQFALILKPFDEQYRQYYELLSKSFFKILNCVLSAFEKHTMKFCDYVLPFIRHYAEIIAIFPRSCYFFNPQKVVKIVKFFTMVLVCPFFRHQFWDSISMLLGPVSPENNKFEKAKLVYDGLNQLLTPDCLTLIIQSVIENHLKLTSEEIDAWQSEPEIYLKDSEASYSIHIPAEELLSALFFRCTEDVKSVLKTFVRQLQNSPQSDEIVLLLDACYRAIGVCRFSNDQVVDINQWYDSELKERIENPEKCIKLGDRILLTRGLWLIRRFSTRIVAEKVDFIIHSVLKCVKSNDLVVSMQAIMTLHSFLLLRQTREDTNQILNNSNNNSSMIESNENPVNNNLNSSDSISPSASSSSLPIGDIIKECFHVLPKLKETDNRIHVLDLVSQLIRIVGYRTIEPHLEEIISYLPSLWSNLPNINNEEESGGEVRLQKSLVTLTSNIIQAIGPSALENPKVGQLSLDLLQFTTNPKGQQALNMLDEGLQLWNSILRATSILPPVLLDLYPRLFEILSPDVEPERGLPILEAYILLGSEYVPKFIPQIVRSIDAIIGRCDYRQSVLAANIIETLLQLFPDDTPKWFLDPTLQRLTRDLVG